MKLNFLEKFSAGKVLIALYILICVVEGYNVYPIIQLTNQSINKYQAIYNNSTRKLNLINQLRKNINTIQNSKFRHVLAYSSVMMQNEERILKKAIAQNDTIFLEYQKLVDSKEEQLFLDTLLFYRKLNAAARIEVIRLSASGQRNQAIDYYVTHQENAMLNYSNAIEDLTGFIVRNTHLKLNITENYIRQEQKSVNILLAFAILLTFITGMMVLVANKKINIQNALLIDQEKKYHTIVETTDEMIFILNTASEITWANSAMKKNLHYNDDELTKLKITDILGEQNKNILQPIALNETKFLNDHTVLITAHGEPIFVEGKYIPFIDNKKITGMQVFIRNITKRKEAEEKLSTTTLQLSHVFDIFDNSFWGSDLVNDRMLYVSPGNEKVFGYPEKYFLANRNFWYELVAQEDKHKFNDVWNFLSNGSFVTIEFRINHPLKGKRWVESKIAPTLNAEGKLIRVDGIAIDITERKNFEDELLENNIELKKINSELDRFVYSTSHDLRAPLLSIEGLINLSVDHIDSKQDLMHYHRIIRKIITEMDDTIKDILDYSRNARLEIVSEQLDIKSIAENAINHVSHMEGRDKIKFSVSVDNTIPFFSDRARVTTVINNLISNAFKYNRSDEQNPFVKFSFVHDKHEGVITVEDNGDGIPGEYMDKIFEMFLRASEKSEGSGLGLYICKEITDRLDGTIKVDSALYKGSTFVVRIPNLQANHTL